MYNPETAPALLRVAAAIARERNYELECLSAIVIPRHQSPIETAVSLQQSLKLFKMAEQIAQTWRITLHTQIRVTHDVGQAILEAEKDRHIDLILIGWRGQQPSQDRIFGDVVDTVMRQAAAEVVVVKWGRKQQYFSQNYTHILNPPSADLQPYLRLNWHRWLVPVRDGSTQAAALQLLPALIQLSLNPNILLLKVMRDCDLEPEFQMLETVAQGLKSRLQTTVGVTTVCTKSVADGIIDVATHRHANVIVLGASREGMLKQVIQGNIPEAIARGCNCTVILVRPAVG